MIESTGIANFSLWSFPQKNCQITILNFFPLGLKVENSDLAHFFEQTTKVKKYLRLSQLYQGLHIFRPSTGSDLLLNWEMNGGKIQIKCKNQEKVLKPENQV